MTDKVGKTCSWRHSKAYRKATESAIQIAIANIMYLDNLGHVFPLIAMDKLPIYY